MRIAILIKQVPALEAMNLGENRRLQRGNAGGEINPFCRRAISKGVELARQTGGRTTVVTLGPPRAGQALREALAWGADEAVLVSDPAFAGSDTLLTARALARTLRLLGRFDLVLVGRNSVDADTGQVGPELAELLGLPFIASARHIGVEGDLLTVRSEQDDGWVQSQVPLPAVLSCAERLCEPAKVSIKDWLVPGTDRVRVLNAGDLGDGLWGEAGSPTRVGALRVVDSQRACQVLRGPVGQQAAGAVAFIQARVTVRRTAPPGVVPPPSGVRAGVAGPEVAVLAGPGSSRITRELLGAGAALAASVKGRVTLIGDRATMPEGAVAASWGADDLAQVSQVCQPDQFAAAVTGWLRWRMPWAVLVPGTTWGREVGARAAAALGAGLIGDAIELECADGRLVAWKSAFGSRVVAAITSNSDIQLVTVRPGVLDRLKPRRAEPLVPAAVIEAPRISRIRQLAAHRDDELGVLAGAHSIVAVGAGVAEHEIVLLEPLRKLLGAEMGASRRVTDRGSLPRSRQIGITGHSVAPELYIGVGVSGKFNHMVGLRRARTVMVINSDPYAPAFGLCDVGIVADWHEAVPALTAELARVAGLATVRAAADDLDIIGTDV